MLKALTAGGGGDTTVFVTANGVVVVDTQDPGGAGRCSTGSRRSPTSPVTMIVDARTQAIT